MASNAKLSKMAGSKDNQYTFNWKLFTGWDYTIGNPETAYNTVMAIIIKIRVSLSAAIFVISFISFIRLFKIYFAYFRYIYF